MSAIFQDSAGDTARVAMNSCGDGSHSPQRHRQRHTHTHQSFRKRGASEKCMKLSKYFLGSDHLKALSSVRSNVHNINKSTTKENFRSRFPSQLSRCEMLSLAHCNSPTHGASHKRNPFAPQACWTEHLQEARHLQCGARTCFFFF